ncbi:MAG: transcriptional repressor [Eubacteriales bacterium]|nr:transcriptional repressor [Eubacteriales bacterium]
MAPYQTEQRKALLDYMHRHADEAFTAGEVAKGMLLDQEVGVKPATSTIYRLLTQLTHEGRIRRLVREEGRQYLYQALACGKGDGHLHLKCAGCGRFIHMGEAQSSKIISEISRKLHFLVDEEQTVLMGRCGGCAHGI